ncbi:MAG: class III lanthionine synthetase LanKC [Corynebacteriales bacterium]|nr:class III lanthionine synthetase LanKC [Mycobacteriales bacterium]
MIPVEYCHPDSVFFEAPGTRPLHDTYGEGLSIPSPWTVGVGPDWTMVTHPDAVLPTQGWKVHVSATPANATQVVGVATKYCLAEAIPFKYIRSPEVLLRRNGKYGSRSGSGKFVTIYPPAERLDDVLTDLGGMLEGVDGPYILTDVRWRSGPLYVRYGGIAPPTARGVDGQVRHLIQDGTGRWVPDSRRPFFRVPEGVPVPEVVARAVADRDRATLGDFPYTVTSALHYSNGGGVYRGTDDRTGTPVLIREARPLAGIDLGGNDAVDRLRAEHAALTALSDIDGVPAVLDHRMGAEHHYLIREYIDGETVEAVAARRRADCDAEDFTAWARSTLSAVESLVDQITARSITVGDLHPGNLLLDTDGRLQIIDLETASTAPDAAQIQAAIGFVAPADRVGPAIDRYALACLAISVFAPGLPATLAWNSDAADVIGDVLTARFGVGDDDLCTVHDRLGTTRPTAVPSRPSDTAPDATACTDIAGLARGVVARARDSGDDRRFPADPGADATPEGPLSLAHGAAGVIGALDRAGVDTTDHVDWLVERVERMLTRAPGDLGWGLYNGLGGVLWTLLDHADTHDDPRSRVAASALTTHLLAVDHATAPLTGALYGGLAGIGLTILRAERSTPTAELHDRAHQILARIREIGPGAGPRAHGLMQGASGAALFATALACRSRDPELLDLAVGWIDRDLDGLDARTMRPTLAADLGVALPLLSLLSTPTAPQPIRDRLDALLARVPAHHIADGAGLFHGWAGAATVLGAAHAHDIADAERLRPVYGTDVLRAYSVRIDTGVAVLGSANLRLSDDLATGTAGVIAALTGLRSGAVGLPGLDTAPGARW